MFPSTKRTFQILLRAPLVPPAPGPATIELRTLSSFASTASTASASAPAPIATPTPAAIGTTPTRPRSASRTLSALSLKNSEGQGQGFGYRRGNVAVRGYASEPGQKELYSDEAGSTGAGTDDVAHTDAAFNKDTNPKTASKGVEDESGKDFTKRAPSNPKQSHPVGKQGETGAEPDLGTSKTEAKANEDK